VSATAHLEEALARWLPPPVRLLARRPSPYASSFPLEELDAEDGDGARHALVWKRLAADALLPDARRARAGTALDATREPRAYELLASAGLGTPRLVGALPQPDGDGSWLFLERVQGTRLDQIGDPGSWRAVARWLAAAHERLTASAATTPTQPLAPQRREAWPPPWHAPDPAEIAAAAHGSRRRRIAALAPALTAAQARATAAPPAVVHGELYPANVLIAERERVCVLDWETIARGPALLDLAALTAGRWDDPGEPLAEAYRSALADPPPPAAELLAELDACRLLLAAAQLAAPAGWTPPPEQARDWLADAELVAERLPP
jgi:aminoglycoside phosphotransferase (APT) family kinase protein